MAHYFGNEARRGKFNIFLALWAELLFPCLKLAPSIYDGACMCLAVGEQELESSDIVEPAAHTHHPAQLFVRKVFIEQQQVVAEVEESLAWAACVESCTTYVVHSAFGHTYDAPAATTKPPTEVYLLHVGKEPAVQTSHTFPITAAHHQRSTCSPEQTLRLVILPMVLFKSREYPAAAEGISINIYIQT